MTGKSEPGWELYRSFLAALQTGSLSAAARVLNLTQPTLGRHIAELENILGIALFTRSSSGLIPTEAAHELEPYAETMAATAAALIRVASGPAQELRGTVRLSASEGIGTEVLPAILADLRTTHPLLTFELVVTNEVSDLLRRDVDIAVRNIRPTQTGLVAKKVGTAALGLHAHESYLKAHGKPKTLRDLQHHALIGFDRENASVRFLQEKGMTFTRQMFALRTDNHLTHLAAIRSGFGIGFCQVPIARRNPDIVRVLASQIEFDLELWLVIHENLRSSHRMRTVFDFLGTALSEYAHPKSARRRQ